MAEARARGFSIATKCATVEELIEKFRDRVDSESILVNTVESREVGTECAFAILLADRKVALAGTCVVHDVYADGNNPFQRPGMRLVIKRLGPQSKKVFDKLVAMRIPPRKLTMALPTVQEPLSRAPRATPYHLDGDVKSRSRPTGASLQVKAEGSANPMLGNHAVAGETRTPGSPHVLPANPLTDVPDASLEHLVDGGLFDASASPARAPEPAAMTEPRGAADAMKILASMAPVPAPGPVEDIARRAARPTVPEPIQRARTQRGQAVIQRAPGLVPLEGQRSEPLPLPPPPQADEPSSSPVLAAIAAAARTNAATAAQPPLAAATSPRVATPPPAEALTRVRASDRLGRQLLAAIICIPLIGGAVVVLYMQLARGRAPDVAALAPLVSASTDDPIYEPAHVEPAPPEIAPVKPPVMHAVLVKTLPIAARVTIGGRAVGSTPTYVKVPANTPVELEIERPGFKPVTYPLISKHPNQRVIVRLQRLPRGAR